MTNNEMKWEIYYFDYSNLCKRFNENKLDEDDNWEVHYNELIFKNEDDIIGC